MPYYSTPMKESKQVDKPHGEDCQCTTFMIIKVEDFNEMISAAWHGGLAQGLKGIKGIIGPEDMVAVKGFKEGEQVGAVWEPEKFRNFTPNLDCLVYKS